MSSRSETENPKRKGDVVRMRGVTRTSVPRTLSDEAEILRIRPKANPPHTGLTETEMRRKRREARRMRAEKRANRLFARRIPNEVAVGRPKAKAKPLLRSGVSGKAAGRDETVTVERLFADENVLGDGWCFFRSVARSLNSSTLESRSRGRDDEQLRDLVKAMPASDRKNELLEAWGPRPAPKRLQPDTLWGSTNDIGDYITRDDLMVIVLERAEEGWVDQVHVYCRDKKDGGFFHSFLGLPQFLRLWVVGSEVSVTPWTDPTLRQLAIELDILQDVDPESVTEADQDTVHRTLAVVGGIVAPKVRKAVIAPAYATADVRTTRDAGHWHALVSRSRRAEDEPILGSPFDERGDGGSVQLSKGSDGSECGETSMVVHVEVVYRTYSEKDDPELRFEMELPATSTVGQLKRVCVGQFLIAEEFLPHLVLAVHRDDGLHPLHDTQTLRDISTTKGCGGCANESCVIHLMT